MSDSIARNPLTTALALELEYRKPSIVRLEPNSSSPQDFNPQGDRLKIEFAYLLSVI
jgi:hypothetical protein